MAEERSKSKNKDYKSLAQALSEAQLQNNKVIKRVAVPITDLWLYGGIAFGNRTAIIGPASHGKSTTLYLAIASLLRSCKKCFTMARVWESSKGEKTYTCACGKNDFMNVLLLDLESRATFPYLKQIGCPVFMDEDKIETDKSIKGQKLIYNKKNVQGAGKLYVLQVSTGEEMYEMVADCFKSNLVQAVAIDALNSIPPAESVDDYKSMMGPQARLHSRGLRILTTVMNSAKMLHGIRPTVLWTNHVTTDIGAYGGPTGMVKYKEAGGIAPKFHEDVCLEMMTIKENDENVTGIPYSKLDHTVVTEFRFKVKKNTIGINKGYIGSYHLFSDYLKTAAFQFKPGMTYESEKLFKLCKKYGLFNTTTKGKNKYQFMGRNYRVLDDIAPDLMKEEIQWEARYWLGYLLSSDLSRFYLSEKDYMYGPYMEEHNERIQKVKAEIDERLGVRTDESERSKTRDEEETNETDSIEDTLE
jgi:RecA/RadA recombinase